MPFAYKDKNQVTSIFIYSVHVWHCTYVPKRWTNKNLQQTNEQHEILIKGFVKHEVLNKSRVIVKMLNKQYSMGTDQSEWKEAVSNGCGWQASQLNVKCKLELVLAVQAAVWAEASWVTALSIKLLCYKNHKVRQDLFHRLVVEIIIIMYAKHFGLYLEYTVGPHYSQILYLSTHQNL